MTSIRNFAFSLATLGTLMLASCSGKPSPVKGDRLNDFFPKSGGGHEIIVITEQNGFAQATLKTSDQEVATLSISDLVNDQEAAQKFGTSSEKIAGYPAISRGSAGTSVLAGRFQVQVRSKGDSFTEANRKEWLGKFDLNGLAAIH